MLVSDLRSGDIFISSMYDVLLILTCEKVGVGMKLKFLTKNGTVVTTIVSGALELVPTEIKFIDSSRGAK